ncbi:MAG: hypothetical protein E7307_01160 [Butyrivibrio sp.]|nr:hypothetical protein [Butyrivibrio sp.]
MSEEVTLNLTPDPKVLIALTHTDIKPLDALCELIDNAIDSFSAAKLQGVSITNPCVTIELPTEKEINEGIGCVRVSDNGPGLTMESAEKALRAGFSGNNPYDTLGLFGMGFNISTGKMGSVTKFYSCREESDKALEVTIDLNKINNEKDYKVKAFYIDKDSISHGTIIEVSNWWPNGNDNRGFIKTLVSYGHKKIRAELGRRYATILREKDIKIFLNGIECEAFEHCVWDEKRYVERSKHGKIPAVFRFNQVLNTQKKCAKCATTLESFQDVCPMCGSKETRTVEERVFGWVGIQRFDDLSEYGIDLIRNGRAIRISEKSAFFEFTDEFQKVIKDYPIDSNFGRIVGEVHLNHVPVDFMKQDFQRSSPEWHRAMVFLRGESSLQPTQPNADKNTSPIFKLFQGYRKVKTAGTTDMYMGTWDKVKDEPRRISRDVEKEFYEKFLQKEQGYYDDAKWWEKVEEADRKPVDKMLLCPSCGCQNLNEAEVCISCGQILKGKDCISCGEKIPYSAKICPKCGKSQEAEIVKPWICNICGQKNDPIFEVCSNCGAAKGEENHLTAEYLLKHSNKNDILSIKDCSIDLSNGTTSTAIKVEVFEVDEEIKANNSSKSMPIFIEKPDLSTIQVFVDPGHRLFAGCNGQIEQEIAYEVASYIQMLNKSVISKDGSSTIPYMAWQITEKYWAERLEGSEDSFSDEVENVFSMIRERLILSKNPDLGSCYDLLTTDQQKELVNNMFNAGEDVANLSTLRNNGEYLKFVPHAFIVKLFEVKPEYFFDGQVWDEPYKAEGLPDDMADFVQERLKMLYQGCLNDLLYYVKYKNTSEVVVKRIELAVKLLRQKVTE